MNTNLNKVVIEKYFNEIWNQGNNAAFTELVDAAILFKGIGLHI